MGRAVEVMDPEGSTGEPIFKHFASLSLTRQSTSFGSKTMHCVMKSSQIHHKM
jgi:hypothetical protein